MHNPAKVLAECRRKFPEYTFLGDVSISKSASVSNRYNEHSLRGIIVDIHMLSLTDYIVGTFSSQAEFLALDHESRILGQRSNPYLVLTRASRFFKPCQKQEL